MKKLSSIVYALGRGVNRGALRKAIKDLMGTIEKLDLDKGPKGFDKDPLDEKDKEMERVFELVQECNRRLKALLK